MKHVLVSLLGILFVGQATAVQFETKSSVGPSMSEYHYGADLDIARVLSHSEIPPVCYVVPVEMTYEDSKGHQHTLRYRVMGSGCLNE
jgi:hypothetical protein